MTVNVCPYSEFYWSAFSRIWTEYEEILRISPYSVRMRENTEQKNSKYGHFLCSELFCGEFSNFSQNRLFYTTPPGDCYCHEDFKRRIEKKNLKIPELILSLDISWGIVTK